MAEKHYFEQQKHTTEYLIPCFESAIPDFAQKRVLEIGCAEGGFLDALAARGMNVAGLELDAGRVELSRKKNPKLYIRVGDVSDPYLARKLSGTFDLIVMRDVIEHVPDKETTFGNLDKLLKEGGFLYITFPPRFSPFAGHQQHGRTLLGKTPYLHLIPTGCLRMIGKWLHEDRAVIETVIHNYQIGLSIRAFERIAQRFGFLTIRKDLFLIRPAFQTRYGMKPRRFANIPLLRELCVMGCECLLQKN